MSNIVAKLRKLFPVQEVPKKKADARVAIALDVIETILIGRMTPKSGYGYLSVKEASKEGNSSYEALALSVKRRGKTKCRVCAIGAAALCAIGLYDDAEVMEKGFYAGGASEQEMREVLSKWFSGQQVDLLESAFECSKFNERDETAESSILRAVRFGERYENAEERLIAIMENIIKNKGLFRP